MPKDERSVGDEADEFLRNLVSTHEGDQIGQGLDDMAKMFYTYFQKLQEQGFHYSKAFVLTRDWHGMWWTTKFNHEMMHMHQLAEGDEQSA
jgi:uncharacterized protein YjlB